MPCAYESRDAAAERAAVRHFGFRAIRAVVEVALRESDQREGADGGRNEPGRGVRDLRAALFVYRQPFGAAGFDRIE